MVTPTNSNERLTFEEIMEKYPDQWVGLDEVEEKDGNPIASAIVKEVGDKADILHRQVFDHAFRMAIYTTPDNSWDNWMINDIAI